ncbi:hypothetical protein [Aneurinibacillus terranovensis]|uniref:hypothetical protein n=1 Tax=Aneurinibacillus terranovensis TaxID=278991 RepID=UPI00041F5700|nr:hypothetical protein [Aneurinibacillus terranovensis]
MKQKKAPKEKLDKNNTFYTYTLYYRYRWKLPMIGLQLILFASSFLFAQRYLHISKESIIHSFGLIPVLWLIQGASFSTFCFTSSLSPRWHIDALLSPWGGWRTSSFLSISNYQQAECMFFVVGIASGLFAAAWWGLITGFFMLSFHLILSIPRIITIFRVQKWKKSPQHYIIKHERLGIGLFSTSG